MCEASSSEYRPAGKENETFRSGEFQGNPCDPAIFQLGFDTDYHEPPTTSGVSGVLVLRSSMERNLSALLENDSVRLLDHSRGIAADELAAPKYPEQ